MSKLKLDPQILASRRLTTGMTLEEVRQKASTDAAYRMSYNENLFGPSPKAVAAIQAEALALGSYPPMGDESLRRAMAQVHGQGLTEDHFYTGCSGCEALELIIKGFLNPGDECIISNPTFGVYNRLVQQQGAVIVDVPLYKEHYTYDIDSILAAVNERTRMVLLCNPNNPTGTIMTAKEMDRLVNEMPDHVLIVSDEVYIHFVTTPDFPNSIQYVLDGKNVVIVQSFSKVYGLPGLRLGYGITTPELADYFSRLHRGFHQSRLAMAAGVAALRDQEHVQKAIAFALEAKDWLYEQLDRLDIAYWPSETNFLMFRTPIPSTELAAQLLNFGVMVKPLAQEGMPDCVRVSIHTPEGNQAFITGLEMILKNR